MPRSRSADADPDALLDAIIAMIEWRPELGARPGHVCPRCLARGRPDPACAALTLLNRDLAMPLSAALGLDTRRAEPDGAPPDDGDVAFEWVACGVAQRALERVDRVLAGDVSTLNDPRHARECARCGAHLKAKARLVCTGCCLNAYCGRECQREAWRAGHKSWCRRAQACRERKRAEQQRRVAEQQRRAAAAAAARQLASEKWGEAVVTALGTVFVLLILGNTVIYWIQLLWTGRDASCPEGTVCDDADEILIFEKTNWM